MEAHGTRIEYTFAPGDKVIPHANSHAIIVILDNPGHGRVARGVSSKTEMNEALRAIENGTWPNAEFYAGPKIKLKLCIGGQGLEPSNFLQKHPRQIE